MSIAESTSAGRRIRDYYDVARPVHFSAGVAVESATLTNSTPVPARRPSENAWLGGVLKQLELIALMPANWDGENADEPCIDILASAAGFLKTIAVNSPSLIEPFVRPTRNGGVLLAWQTEEDDLEVNFESGDMATFAYSKMDGSEEKGGTLVRTGLREASNMVVLLKLLLRHFRVDRRV